jgi:WD40 repeat protein
VDENGRVEVRDVASGRLLRPPLPGLGQPAQALALSPVGDRLAVADRVGNLRLLDLRSGAVRGPQSVGPSLLHLSFSPDGKTLALGLEERAELRDARSLRVLAGPQTRGGEGGWVRFSPDGRLLAVGSVEGYTQLWDVATRRPVGAPLAGHEAPVLAAEFSPDGRMLATSAFDGTVILWDVRSRRSLGTLPAPAAATAARFSRDGRRLFVLRETGQALRWEVTPEAWSQHACRVAGRDLTRAEWADVVADQDYRRICP